MTLDKAPLAIDGVLTGASSLRKGLMAAIGGGGVARATDLKVSASVPNGQSLQIAPGLGVVPNGYQTTPDEVYVESNPTGHAITSADMPSASASTTYWLVCLVVGDPSYGDQTGHPFMPSDFDEDQANTFQYVRPVLLPCSSTTTTFEELGKHYPGLALARVAIPPSTTTITDAMITDVRKVARASTLTFDEGTTDQSGISGAAAIAGLSRSVVSPGPNAAWLVTIDLEYEAAGTIWAPQLLVDGAQYKAGNVNSNGRLSYTKSWKVTGLAAGNHTISVAVNKITGNNFRVIGPNSSLTIQPA